MALPRTWITAELVTASIMNGVRDQLIALSARPLAFSLGDPGGAVITTGSKFTLYVKDGLRISRWTIAADQSGSIVIDLWKATYPTFPTVAGTITGTEKPTLAAQRANQDATLSTWIVDIPSDSFVTANVDSCTTIKQATITLDGNLLSMV